MAKPNKLRWRVSPAPTGMYRSFEHRSWPIADLNGEPAISLRCDREYVPSEVRAGDHPPLTVCVALVSQDPEKDGAFTWRALKQKADTLDEAKKMAQRFVYKYPEHVYGGVNRFGPDPVARYMAIRRGT